MKAKIIVFDLDDTLYNELDYLISAYKEISEYLSETLINQISKEKIFEEMYSLYDLKKNVFFEILEKYNIKDITVEDLLRYYRNHIPQIKLENSVENLLNYLKEKENKLGIITDGRSVQQRNKITSLNIEKYFENIIISEEFGSEKPDLKNFQFFEKLYPECEYVYIGDNVKKDFFAGNLLGWTTICVLDNGKNIHKQKFNFDKEYLPNYRINNLEEVLNIIEK
ncbi:HAD family hydrolase [Flavobacterium phragmitis]|uniref:Putative hydrolase of the HAD superfamily n=1 Tax=Flavobacterium phragmitis TaxID=739143 RepID=A0A1I1UQJ1_9FLAO|nr:HAD-IA family hydrolase [Flavobacterium phragmitis]SFD73092.1 putative hydrolase of the HAD superfamily [Flavobacterium phragmitis]